MDTLERIRRMRNGERIKCPKCDKGYWVALGTPETAYAFHCDSCDLGMVLTKRIPKETKNE